MNTVGVIGLAVMGRNLALNIAEHGFSVAVYNRSPEKTRELLRKAGEEKLDSRMEGYEDIGEFVRSLEVPRKIIMMVKAGDAVDATIRQLLPLLSQGDLLMDGGNSYYADTVRRNKELKEKGIYYLGTGISGGEEGARRGPAIMPGGSGEAYRMIEPVLTEIAAKVGQESCCTYIGEDGAGHFVKMVHNGIEYADMQLIAEAYDILRKVCQLTPPELQKVFTEWNEGELNSYLIDITADIFGKKDSEEITAGSFEKQDSDDITANSLDQKASGTERYLVDQILDVAGQKGTGKWTGQISLDLGTPVPTITSAVYERYLSAMKEERVAAGKVLMGPKRQNRAAIAETEKLNIGNVNSGVIDSSRENKLNFDRAALIESVRRALYASKICAYAQGFGLLRSAAQQFGWRLDYGAIAKIFRGGCIIRAQFLNKISEAYDKNPELKNLLLEEYFSGSIGKYQEDWREVIKTAITYGISVPAFSSSLAYYDSYRAGELPMNLLQAQRDYFGAHTYERIDREGTFHTAW